MNTDTLIGYAFVYAGAGTVLGVCVLVAVQDWLKERRYNR